MHPLAHVCPVCTGRPMLDDLHCATSAPVDDPFFPTDSLSDAGG